MAECQYAVMQPCIYDDPETGDRIEIAVSPYYSKISVNRRTYYFVRETGQFDGAATEYLGGPILVVSDRGDSE